MGVNGSGTSPKYQVRNGSKNSLEIPNSTRICPDRLQVYCSDLNHIVQARVSGEKFSSGDGLTCVDLGLRASLRVRSEVDSGCETPSHTPPSAEKSDSEQLQEPEGKQNSLSRINNGLVLHLPKYCVCNVFMLL